MWSAAHRIASTSEPKRHALETGYVARVNGKSGHGKSLSCGALCFTAPLGIDIHSATTATATKIAIAIEV
jgi:hypothetical protein